MQQLDNISSEWVCGGRETQKELSDNEECEMAEHELHKGAVIMRNRKKIIIQA